jgi:hypothetical protein
MSKKLNRACLCFIIVAEVCLSVNVFALTTAEMQEEAVLHATPQELFRDYAFTTCLGAAMPQIKSQASAAANGYIQYGEGPAEAYENVGKAAQEFLKRDYVSQTGADLSIMKCIDFMHSRELSVLMKRYFH